MIADRLRDLLRVNNALARRAGSQSVEFLAGAAVMRARLGQMLTVGFLPQQRQQLTQRCAHIADNAEIDRRAAADVFRADIDLRDAHSAASGIKLPVRKIGTEHQQDIAVEHRVIAGREPDQPGHPHVVGVGPFDVLLAPQRMHHRRLQAFAEREKLVMGASAARTAQDRDAAVTIQQRCEAIQIRFLRRDDRPWWQQAGGFRHRRGDGRLQRDVTRNSHDRHAALADRLADRDLDRARHLAGAGDQFAVMAALAKQVLRVRLLEIAAADFG